MDPYNTKIFIFDSAYACKCILLYTLYVHVSLHNTLCYAKSQKGLQRTCFFIA
jgi:hypothetical protein